MIGKSYCREKTRNQSRFISFVPDMVAEVEEQEESLEAVVGAQWQVNIMLFSNLFDSSYRFTE